MMNHTTTYRLDEIKAISFFSTSLNTKQSEEEVLWAITKNVVHQLGLVDCVIYKLDPEEKLLIQKAAYGQKNPADTIIHNKIAIKLGEGIVGSVAKNRKSEIVSDTSKDPRYIIDDEKRLSELCVPIILNRRLFGVIDTEHPEQDFFTEKHLHLLTIIASLCSQRIKTLSIKGKKPPANCKTYFEKLETLIRFKKIYRDPNLGLSTAANLLGISPCYLSSMINTLNNNSFIDYINGYRVADVKKSLHAEEYRHYTILSIGLEAGFNSKSAFYSSFKKHTGLTPTQYRQKRRLVS